MKKKYWLYVAYIGLFFFILSSYQILNGVTQTDSFVIASNTSRYNGTPYIECINTESAQRVYLPSGVVSNYKEGDTIEIKWKYQLNGQCSEIVSTRLV